MIDLVRHIANFLSRREKGRAALLLGAMMLGSVFEMFGVGAIPVFVSALTHPEALRSRFGLDPLLHQVGLGTHEEFVLASAGALLAVFVIKNSYAVFLSLVQSRYVFGLQGSIARRLFETYLFAPYTLHTQRNPTELLRNTNQDAMSIVGTGLMPLLQLAMETFTVTAILALLLVVEPITSLAAFGILGGATAVFLRVVRARMVGIGERERDARQRMLQAVNEGLNGIKITKVLGREEYFLHRFGVAAEGYAKSSRTRQVLHELARVVLETFAVGGLLGVAALLLSQGRSLDAMIPTLALLGVAVVRLIPCFNRISGAFAGLRYGQAAIRAIRRDLDEIVRRPPTVSTRLSFKDRLAIDHVTFQYPAAAKPALSDVSFEIPRGTAVGIVGPTGSGKTTLADVILGLLQPAQGAVRVDETSISGIERAWQMQLGYVPQDTYLADTTIRSNIAFGLPVHEIDDAALRAAVEAAQLGDFIASLPLGLDTVVGDRGVRLSGGQRQRIGIARALYHDPAVIVLDEATSSLDNETERYVMEAIERLRGGRTLIIIAHRMTTVRACDCLFFLREGRLAAQGTYSELLRINPEFGRMVASSH